MTIPSRPRGSSAGHPRPAARLLASGGATALLASTVAMAAPARVEPVGVSSEGTCVATVPDRYRHALAEGTIGKRDVPSTVIEATKAKALAELRAVVCADMDPARCDRVRSRMGVYHTKDLGRGLACAVALVSTAVVDDPDGLARDEEAVASLAASVGERGQAVAVSAARWQGGCGAGEAGAWATSMLRTHLAALGATVAQDAPVRLEPVLVRGPVVVLEVWRRAGAGAATLAGSASLSGSWLSEPGGACRDDAALGVRSVAGPLVPSLELSGPDLLCAGEATHAVLAWSGGDAVAQLWSVGQDGTGQLLWSGAGRGPVRADLTASWAADVGEERLVGLVAPSAAALPPGEVGCRLSPLVVPSGVASAAVPFQVLRPGRGRCAAQTEADGGDDEAPACR